MKLLPTGILQNLRRPIDQYLAIRKLKAFHQQPRSLDEVVDAAMNFGGHGDFRVRTVQIRSEILSLAKRVAELKPRNILEIGTARGGTLFIWSQLATNRVVSCDIAHMAARRTLYEHFASPNSNCHCHLEIGNSHDPEFAASVEKLFNGEQVDFLFIDGDHTEVGVREDYELYQHLVRPGGLIGFHDIVINQPTPDNQVYHFWKYLKQNAETEEFVEDYNQCGFGIGVVKKAA